MAFTRSWNENDPDGDVITISQLDDSQRDIKVSVRERLEGDATDPYSGIFEKGSFQNAARIRKGTARAHVDTDANIAGLPKMDGAMAISSDGKRLYHIASSGPVEIEYMNRNGARAATGDFDLGNHVIKNLKAATAAGQAVEFAQAAIINQQRTVSANWTFNRGAGLAPFSISDSVSKVINLDADKLDGYHASDFVLASNLNIVSDVIGKTVFNADAFGTAYETIGDLTVVLNQGGAWVFKYFLGVTITGSFKVKVIGATVSVLSWLKGTSSGSGSEITTSDSGILEISGFISGNSGASISLQAQGVTNSGTISQGSSCIAVKVH